MHLTEIVTGPFANVEEHENGPVVVSYHMAAYYLTISRNMALQRTNRLGAPEGKWIDQRQYDRNSIKKISESDVGEARLLC